MSKNCSYILQSYFCIVIINLKYLTKKQNLFKSMSNSDRAGRKNNENSNVSFLSDRSAKYESEKKNPSKIFPQNDEVEFERNEKLIEPLEEPKGRLWIIESVIKSIAPESLCGERKQCTICEQWFEKQKIKEFGKCKHSFCQSCLKEYLLVKINLMQLVSCPAEGCEAKLDQQSQAFQELLSLQQKAKYKKVQIQVRILSDPKLRQCKKETCEGIINLKDWKDQIKGNAQQPIICTKCKLEYCKECFEAKHEGSCEKHMVKFLERNKKFRQCSVCKRVIEKTQGCTHMTCLCGNYFCYMCGQSLGTDIHQCIIPSGLNCVQKIRWEIEHKEMFYESNMLSFHRCLYCFQLPGKIPGPLRLLYSLVYTLSVYPISIVLSLILVAFFFVLVLLVLTLLFLFLPLSELCTQKDYAITICLNEMMGYFGLAVCVIVFYPIFVLAIMIESIFEVCKNDESWEQVGILFKEIGTGLRNVLIMPFVLCVNPESLDEAQQSLNERIQNGV